MGDVLCEPAVARILSAGLPPGAFGKILSKLCKIPLWQIIVNTDGDQPMTYAMCAVSLGP